MPDRPQVIILHIDDNEANRYVVTRMLRNAGFDVKQATTGETGVQIALEQQPDLIVLDVQLPDINGFEVCRRLKANPATTFIPVLHLSASFVKSEDKVQGLDSGADGYLAQPVEAIELVATVNALLRTTQAEEAARLLAKEWQTTFDAIADGVCLLDCNGAVVRCNFAARELWGKPESEIKGCFYGDLMRDMLVAAEVNPFIRAQETCRRENLELRFGDRWFSVTADPILGDRGTFAGAVWIVADITDRKQAELAQQQSEERFRLLLENVKDYAIFFLDTQGRIIRWSTGAQRILGYQEAEVLGQPASIIFTPEDLASGIDKQELEQALAEGQAEEERWHIRKDGSRFWASGIVTSLQDEAGLRGFAKIMRDFTERKQTEDERAQLLLREQNARTQAETANRMKDEFLATLSHELRSPLNAMLGWLRLLNTRKFNEKTTAKAMETIERSAKAQAQLVEDLLDVSRIIQGKVRLNVRPVELVPIIEAALETMRPAAEAKEIRLHTVFDSAAGPVAG
ncbi:MAG TPA: PAS domain S-box protein, partial [Kamptonema sp.]|nr:PAS domain S-box protein [Kamptonema sp.]